MKGKNYAQKMKQYYNSLSIITKAWIFVSILFIIYCLAYIFLPIQR